MAHVDANENNDKALARQAREQETHRERLSKRLCYILRYAAMREGLQVDDAGNDNEQDSGSG